MSCDACDRATREPSHDFRQDCRGCCARAAARSPQFALACKLGKQDRAYRALLDQFGLTHAEVKEAYETDRLGKEATCDDSC